MRRLAIISVHGCPVVQAGEKDAGGMNIYVLETARVLAERGVQVDVFTRHHDPLDPMVIHLSPGARVIHMPAGPPGTGKNGVFNLLDEFTSQVLEFAKRHNLKYDVIASHYWLSGLVGNSLRDTWRAPHVTSFHTLAEVKRLARPDEREHPARTESEKQIARSVDQIVVWTEHECRALVELYGAPPGRITVIPPGVDSRDFVPSNVRDTRRELGIGDERVLLFVGRLERLKGIDIVLQALALLDHPDGIRLYIAGGDPDSPELPRLRAEAERVGVGDSVVFLGSVTRDVLCQYYNAADVCVLPSYYESFGFAALEAAACGTPVVASRVGGLTTVVKDGETGFLIPWHCPGPFVERLDLLLHDDGLRREMGEAARRHAETLTWDAAVDRLTQVYNRLEFAATAEAEQFARV